MLANIIDMENTLGKTKTSEDEIIISYATVYAQSFNGEELDVLLPKVIAHELAHSLCLGSGTPGIPELVYPEQYNGCIYEKMDKQPSETSAYRYNSIMHYAHLSNTAIPLSSVNFSDGNNIIDDHDDWGAIEHGVKDFSIPNKNYNYYSLGAVCYVECN